MILHDAADLLWDAGAPRGPLRADPTVEAYEVTALQRMLMRLSPVDRLVLAHTHTGAFRRGVAWVEWCGDDREGAFDVGVRIETVEGLDYEQAQRLLGYASACLIGERPVPGRIRHDSGVAAVALCIVYIRRLDRPDLRGAGAATLAFDAAGRLLHGSLTAGRFRRVGSVGEAQREVGDADIASSRALRESALLAALLLRAARQRTAHARPSGAVVAIGSDRLPVRVLHC